MGFRRVFGAIVFILLWSLFAPPVVFAQGMDPTVVVLDASGSMTDTDVGGVSRMDAAKQAVGEFVDQVPATDGLGLVTYGTGTGSSDEEKEAGCQDISVLAGLGEKDKEGLKADVAGLVPRGYTPIGNALRKANELLPREGSRSIVLVSDGIDTCAPPPVCEVAKELKDQGVDLVVHTIGFMVDDAARAELECIAQVTGGMYSDASSADALRETLTKATTRTAVGYQLPQEVVQFSTDKSQAPVIEPGTLESPRRIHAKMPAEDSENIYAKVSIPEGHRLHIGFNAVPPVGTRGALGGNFQLYPRLVSAGNHSCGVVAEDSSATSAGNPYAGALISKVQGADQQCSADFYYLEIEEKWDAPKDIDMILAAVPEPADVGDDFNQKQSTKRETGDLSPAADAGELQTTQPLTQWDSAAPEVSGTIVSEIVEGETQYFPVIIGWGQALDVTVQVLEDPGAGDVSNTEAIGRALEFHMQNQLGQDMELAGSSNRATINDLHEPQVFGTRWPISYANVVQNASWLGGRQYVQISFTSMFRGDRHTDATTELQPVKYRLTFTPVGGEVTGPTLEGDDTNAEPSGDETDATQLQAEDDSAGIGMVWWLIIAIAVLALIGMIALVLRLTRGSKSGSDL